MNRDDPALIASIRQRLLNLAKERGEDFNLMLRRYALERFLYRLSGSEHRTSLILKGAMLLQVWSQIPVRATRDMDFLATSQTDGARIQEIVYDICARDVKPDGLQFDLSSLDIHEIREDDRYGGLRATFLAKLGTAKIPIQMDFGMGDEITPAPREVDYPVLLDMARPHVLAYPRETVVAEKLEAIVSLAMRNSRMKDFFDLWFILTTFDDEPSSMAIAVKRTFAKRSQPIPEEVPIGLSDEFTNDPEKQLQWKSFIGRVSVSAPTLESVITIIRPFAMEIFRIARS